MTHQVQFLQDKLQQQWETSRLGVLHCRSNEPDRERLLNWLDADKGDPLSRLWIEILLNDRPDLVRVLLDNLRFPEGREDRGLLRQLVTSSPFPLLRTPVR